MLLILLLKWRPNVGDGRESGVRGCVGSKGKVCRVEVRSKVRRKGNKGGVVRRVEVWCGVASWWQPRQIDTARWIRRDVAARVRENTRVSQRASTLLLLLLMLLLFLRFWCV